MAGSSRPDAAVLEIHLTPRAMIADVFSYTNPHLSKVRA